MPGPRILVVDDDRSACTVVSQILAGEGYEVNAVNNGAAALQELEQHNYDLAILDYQMPEMDGVELCQKIRQTKPEVATIFLTAFTTINTVFPAIGAGAERVLSKPVDQRELLPLVEELVGRP